MNIKNIKNIKIVSFISIVCFLYFALCCILTNKYGIIVSKHIKELFDAHVLCANLVNIFTSIEDIFNKFDCKVYLLYFLGMLNAFSILLCIYFIVKEISNVKTAIVTSLSTMMIFLIMRFSTVIVNGNYFHFNFSLLYMFSPIFFALLFYTLYKCKKVMGYFYAFVVLSGISILLKFDYLFLIFLILYELYILNSSKVFIKSIVIFISSLMIGFIVNSGFGWNIYDAIDNLFKVSPNGHNLLFNLNDSLFKQVLYSAVTVLKFFVGGFLILLLSERFNKNTVSIFWSRILFFLSFIGIIMLMKNDNSWVFGQNAFIFDYPSMIIWFLYLLLFFAFVIIALKRIKKISIDVKEKLFLIVLFLLLILNKFCILPLLDNGMSIIFVWMLFVYFFMEILPDYIKYKDKDELKYIFSVVIILFSFLYIV